MAADWNHKRNMKDICLQASNREKLKNHPQHDVTLAPFYWEKKIQSKSSIFFTIYEWLNTFAFCSWGVMAKTTSDIPGHINLLLKQVDYLIHCSWKSLGHWLDPMRSICKEEILSKAKTMATDFRNRMPVYFLITKF